MRRVLGVATAVTLGVWVSKHLNHVKIRRMPDVYTDQVGFAGWFSVWMYEEGKDYRYEVCFTFRRNKNVSSSVYKKIPDSTVVQYEDFCTLPANWEVALSGTRLVARVQGFP